MAASHLGYDRLTTLPVELVLAILTVLPMRQIVQLRQLSRHFRELVDGNKSTLTRQSLAYNRSRLRSRHQRLTDFRGLELVDVVHQYISYYGIIYESNDLEVVRVPYPPIFKSFRATLIESTPGFARARRVAHEKLWWFISTLQRACAERDGETRVSECHPMLEMEDFFPRAAPMDRRAPFFGNRDNLIAKLENKDLFCGPHYTRVHGKPQYFLTFRMGMSDCLEAYYPRPWDYGGTEVTSRILLLPDLKQRFSYCIKTQAMASIFWDAAAEVGDFAASRFRQAAVLEEMFIW
ncbi:hypothetical protein B0A48_04320 [Cryoendolithus antarcticus]|uniref:F-box domain-containing protein n=1 Tax=Cryoendolithus antarcticus TaxID=1507870 RepID=A0A1V8TF16_9PEZI|nr:hypothetical protein B0A48_04320 [Cryoendolithus antarcticus]